MFAHNRFLAEKMEKPISVLGKVFRKEKIPDD